MKKAVTRIGFPVVFLLLTVAAGIGNIVATTGTSQAQKLYRAGEKKVYEKEWADGLNCFQKAAAKNPRYAEEIGRASCRERV